MSSTRLPFRFAAFAWLFLLISSLTSSVLLAQPFTITTVAGKSAPEGALGTDVQFYEATAIATDLTGNVYVVERFGRRVRKLATDGTMTTIAGTGVLGAPAVGSPANQSPLNDPRAVAVTEDGTVYIADSGTGRIYSVEADGILRVFAGGGSLGFGNFGDGGPATDATFRFFSRMAMGPDGSLYVSVTIDSLVRRITPGGIVEKVAGIGERGFSGDGGPATGAALNDPSGMAFDADGNLYIADSTNRRIRKVDTEGIITTVAGGGISNDDGPALEFNLAFPTGVAVHPESGLIFITNTNADTIVTLDAEGNIATYAGDPFRAGFGGDGIIPRGAVMNNPTDLAVNTLGDLLVLDMGNQRIRRLRENAANVSLAGTGNSTGDGGPAEDAHIYTPSGLAIGDSGEVIITGAEDARIRAIDFNGIIGPFAGDGISGSPADGGVATEERISFIDAVDLDAEGNVYFPDRNARKVYRIKNGIITVFLEQPAARNYDLVAIDRPRGVAYFGRSFGYYIDRIDLATQTITPYVGTGESGFSGDGGPADAAQIHSLAAISVDRDGNLYIAGSTNNRVRKVDAETGIITTIAGTGTRNNTGDGGPATEATLGFMTGLAAAANGTVYVSDSSFHQVRRIDAATGIIETVVNQEGGPGFGGDGGPAADAKLNVPSGLAIDPQGNLYISDTNNLRIRKLTTSLAQLSVVNAAGIPNGSDPTDFGAGSIVSVYGADMAADLVVGNGSDVELGETSAVVTDSQGVTRDAGLYFVSGGQINLVIPDEAAQGAAILTVRRNGVPVASVQIEIVQVAPALFSADATGTGLAAAGVLIVTEDGTQIFEMVAPFENGVPVAKPVDLTRGDVYLILYGTGIRNAGELPLSAVVGGQSVPVLGFAAQSQFPGLDQVNIGPLPADELGGSLTLFQLQVGPNFTNTLRVLLQ